MEAKYNPPVNLEDENMVNKLPIQVMTYAIKIVKMSNIHKDKQIEHLKNEKTVLNYISN